MNHVLRCLLFSLASLLSAQTFEAGFFGGYRFSGYIPLDDQSPYRKLDVPGGAALGARFGYQYNDEDAVEFEWNRQNTSVTSAPATASAPSSSFPAWATQYHVNFLHHYFEPDARIRPYILGGLGATAIQPRGVDVDSITRFSFAVGGGVKIFPLRWVGVRLQGRWAPTLTSGGAETIFCGANSGCFVSVNGRLLQQADLTAGVTFRFP